MKQDRSWIVLDLHLHTPASSDYQEPDISYLDILRTAKARGVQVIALTDHNTVAGIRSMQEDIQRLTMLEELDRIRKEEKERLAEYRKLLDELLVLPGFEFTATFGFHILGIFPPEKPVRELEHLLLSLNIPSGEIDAGASNIGASSDVLAAYQVISEAGGIAIAAHANSSNGIAMRGFPIGGQTKIAYTQDSNLHALEVTDLEGKGRRSTSAFFNGTKPEYPRRMHCIQGSDAHSLSMDPKNDKKFGVGGRATEMLLSEISFEAIKELLQGNDFARTRPHVEQRKEEFDFIQPAIEEGASIVQEFHQSMTVRGGHLYAIIADVCAFANTNGGTVFVGIEPDRKGKPAGISNPSASVGKLRQEISNRISPPLKVQVDSQATQGVTVIRVLVPRGEDLPYAVDDNKIYVREEAETGLAVRDEIVQMVRGVKEVGLDLPAAEAEAPKGTPAPKTGVEIVAVEEREGVQYFTVRDLRNGNVVKNVTETSARRLWHYAITQYLKLPKDVRKATSTWDGELGLLRTRGRGKSRRYDLAQALNGSTRLYFGVTEDGIHGPWLELVEKRDLGN
ncbi:MAG: RNA-binding domain-containing protein [Anaerolineales bacterium]